MLLIKMLITIKRLIFSFYFERKQCPNAANQSEKNGFTMPNAV